MPPNVFEIITTLKYIALGEFIPYERMVNWFKELFGIDSPQTSEELDALESAGATSSNIFDNMGAMLVIGIGLIVVVLLIGALSFCLKKDKEQDSENELWIEVTYKVRFHYEMLKNKLFWNTFIRFSQQSYLKLLMAAAASLSLLSFASPKSAVSSIVNLVVTACLVSLPLIYKRLISSNRGDLKTTFLKNRIGTLYTHLKSSESDTVFFNTLYMTRRMYFVLLTYLLRSYPNFVVHLFYQSVLVQIVYLWAKQPYATTLHMAIEIFNEV